MNPARPNNRGYALIVALIITAVAAALVLGFITEVNTTQKISNNDKDYSGAFYGAEAGLEKMNSDLAKLFLKKVFPSTADLLSIHDAGHVPSLPSTSFPSYDLSGGQSTRLTAALTSTATTASVTSTDGWPTRGFFMIDAEEITYTGTTATTFTGLARGQNWSAAAAHTSNARVFRSAVVTLSEGANAGLIAQTIPFTLDVTARTGVGTEARLRREVQVALIPVFQFGVFSDSDLSFFAGPNFDFGGRVHSNRNIFLAEGNSGTLTLSQKITSAEDIIRKYLANGVSVTASYMGPVNVASSPGVYRALSVDEGSVIGGPGSAANGAWPGLSLSTYNKNILSKSTGAKALTLPFVADGYAPIELIKRPPDGEDTETTMGQSRLANQASLRVFISDNEAQLPGGTGHALNSAMVGYVPINDGIDFRPPFAEANAADPDFVTVDDADETMSSPIVNGYILIQRHNTDGTWTDVTLEILNLGISTNQANAILRFQKPKWDLLDTTNSLDRYDYLPLNMYDAREGRFRDDNSSIGTNLRKLGIMNVIELDVRRLKDWFAGTIGTTGSLAVENNGYIFYFSDRRGNRDSGGNETGELGFEDFVNPGDINGDPNGSLNEGEDLNGDTALNLYGANLPYSPYSPSTDLYDTALPAPVTQAAINLSLPVANTTTTSFNVSSVSGLSPGYYRIDNEIVNCTAVASTPITCLRGQLGTAAATHIPTSAISLTADVTSTATNSFVVKSDTNVAVPGYYRVDNETILCTSKTANVLTCQRGMMGTTPATHTAAQNAVSTNVTAAATSISLAASTGFPTAAAWYRIEDETVQCTRSSTTLTCIRAQLGTTATPHPQTPPAGISASINSTTTTLPFTSGATSGFVVPNYYRIDNETVRCTAKTATSMTCTRAQLSTSAASHASGATVRLAISASLSSTTTTNVTVSSTASVVVPDYYKIDNEILHCASKTATVFTCTRGQLGTSAATHSAGAALQSVLTVGLVNVQPVNLFTSERASKNRVHYFRRALRLVNGTSPNLPTPGFTVASENPVYVMGNYNSNGDPGFTDTHSSAAVIADAVTLLSNNWATGGDERSFIYPYAVGSRPGSTTYYRMAIASGKGINFPKPSEESIQDFGTDGGTHNFLRYLESWSGTSYYRGSLVSLYYYRQAIGPYKCCNSVYSPPTREYAFDTEFLVPAQLPPGTPRFRDVNNLSFRQTIRADNE